MIVQAVALKDEIMLVPKAVFDGGADRRRNKLMDGVMAFPGLKSGCFFVRRSGVSPSRLKVRPSVARRGGQHWPKATKKWREAVLRAASTARSWGKPGSLR